MKAFRKALNIVSLFGQAIRGEEQNFTQGSINRAIFMLSIPMILEMVMESLLAVVDILFISLLKDNDAVTAVGLTESIIALVYSIAMGLGMAATALVSRRVGEKDLEGAAVASANAMFLGFAVSLLISFVGVVFYKDLLILMGASQEVVEVGSGYTLWMLGGNLSIVALFLINALFRGAGNAAIAMRSLWIANVLNMVLDPILIFGWGPIEPMGVEGAAIATNIGRTVGVLYQVLYLIKGMGIVKMSKRHFTLSKEVINRLLRMSSENIGQFLISTVSWLFLARTIVESGSTAFAGYQIAIRVIIFTILPSWGMANAAATLVGQNLGAGQPERAEKSVWKAGFLNMVFLGFVSIFFFLFSRGVMGIFSDDPGVIEVGSSCLRIVAFGYLFYGYGMVIIQSFNGAGDTRTPIYLNICVYWLFQIPLAWVLSRQFGAQGVFWAIAISESAIAVVGIIIFRRGKWKTTKV